MAINMDSNQQWASIWLHLLDGTRCCISFEHVFQMKPNGTGTELWVAVQAIGNPGFVVIQVKETIDYIAKIRGLPLSPGD